MLLQYMPDAMRDFFEHFEKVSILRQSAIIVTSLLVAWLTDGLIRRITARISPHWQFGAGGINRIAFPLVAVLGISIGKAILHKWQSIYILNVATDLLLALALIRFVVYLLRHVFSPSAAMLYWERVIATVVWFGLAFQITGIMPDLLKNLDDISVDIGHKHISLLTVLQGLISVAITMLIALWLGKMLEARIMRTETLDMNVRVVITKAGRALLIVVGVILAMAGAGIDLTVLSVFGGALGVGLGFGLQKIASNYISGFIILLDKSVHLGDMIQVGDRYGEVSNLTARYTVLKSLDGTESIIPNETFISSVVVNQSYTNRLIMIRIPIQISYESDLERAMALMLEIAHHSPRVLNDPEPKAYLTEFADSGINLALSIWIQDPEEGQMSLRSEINLALWRAFKENGISIPYPQREIRILS